MRRDSLFLTRKVSFKAYRESLNESFPQAQVKEKRQKLDLIVEESKEE